MVEIIVVAHRSEAYWQAVEIRHRILRHPLGLEFTDEELADESRDGHIVALEAEKVVGCLVMTPINCSVVKMRQVAVEPDLQGQGLGKQLVKASEDWATSWNYTQIELSAREPVVPFYLALGYQLIGDPFIEVTIEHRKMVKDL